MLKIFTVQFIAYILVYPIIWLLSILPMPILHFFSDIIYYIVYYIVGYRKKVVFGNLKYAFPDKSDDEIKKIAKKSYRHFIDIFVEMIKSFTISEKELAKRWKIKNIHVLKELEEQHKSAILYGAHYANWEWVFILNTYVKYTGFAIYKKIANKYFDKKIKDVRGKYNTVLVPTKEIFDVVEENNRNNTLSLYGFLGDQTPKAINARHWASFFNVVVPIQTGTEFFAKKYDIPIVFFSVERVKRSYYECTFKILTDDPKKYNDYEITDMYLAEVEKQVHKAPEYYFWTHKRFKHKDKAPEHLKK